MDAQIYRFRCRSTQVFAPDSLLNATRSLAEFMAWYGHAMLTWHVALVNEALRGWDRG